MKLGARAFLSCCLMSISMMTFADDKSSAKPPELSWKSQKESGVYGYIVYRAEQAGGPFLRLNSRIIPLQAAAATTVSDIHEYRYIDETATPGRAYYYYIDAIGDSGRRQRLTNIVRREP